MGDRRMQKTKQSIKMSFITLLKKYKLEEITVRQITDEANINRATFYKHYYDKYDLLNSLEDKEMDNLKKLFDKIRDTYNIASSKEQILTVLDDMPKSAIDIISENIDLYRVLFQMNRESQIEVKLSELMAKNIQFVLKKDDYVNDIPFRYFHSYVSGAMISIIKLWVLDEDRIPEGQLLENIAKLSLDGPMNILINRNINVR